MDTGFGVFQCQSVLQQCVGPSECMHYWCHCGCFQLSLYWRLAVISKTETLIKVFKCAFTSQLPFTGLFSLKDCCPDFTNTRGHCFTCHSALLIRTLFSRLTMVLLVPRSQSQQSYRGQCSNTETLCFICLCAKYKELGKNDPNLVCVVWDEIDISLYPSSEPLIWAPPGLITNLRLIL